MGPSAYQNQRPQLTKVERTTSYDGLLGMIVRICRERDGQWHVQVEVENKT